MKQKKRCICFLLSFLVFVPLILFAEKCKEFDPWYSGPIIAGSPNNLAPGWVNYQPYIYLEDHFGHYGHNWKRHGQEETWAASYPGTIQTGIFHWLDVTVGYTFYDRVKQQTSSTFGDMTCAFGIQLLKDKKNTAIPSVRLILKESFPTGKFRNGKLKNGSAAFGGSGSYETRVELNIGKVMYWWACHPLSWRLNFKGLVYPTKVHVENYHAYGGTYGTKGKVIPGYFFTFVSAMEFSITQNWVFAMDFSCNYTSTSKFSGYPGITPEGIVPSNTVPESVQISLAPAIEYNFTENVAFIQGLWFTVAGKNVPQFISLVMSVTATF